MACYQVSPRNVATLFCKFAMMPALRRPPDEALPHKRAEEVGEEVFIAMISMKRGGAPQKSRSSKMRLLVNSSRNVVTFYWSPETELAAVRQIVGVGVLAKVICV